jgi:hypothetical protein
VLEGLEHSFGIALGLIQKGNLKIILVLFLKRLKFLGVQLTCSEITLLRYLDSF